MNGRLDHHDKGIGETEVAKSVIDLLICKPILDSSNDSAIRNAYNNIFESHKCGKLNWCTFVTDILVEANMGRKWDEQYIRNIEIMKISN